MYIYFQYNKLIICYFFISVHDFFISVHNISITVHIQIILYGLIILLYQKSKYRKHSAMRFG